MPNPTELASVFKQVGNFEISLDKVLLLRFLKFQWYLIEAFVVQRQHSIFWRGYGVEWSARLGINFPGYFTIPRNLYSSITDLDKGILVIASVFEGSILTLPSILFLFPAAIPFFSGYFDSAIRNTTFLPCFCHFAGQISYPFDFISGCSLLVKIYGNNRPIDAIFCQAQSQKFKVLDLHNITLNTLSTGPTDAY